MQQFRLNQDGQIMESINLLTRASSCQKQPSRGAPRERCSENMQQMYRRTPMAKCNFNNFNNFVRAVVLTLLQR